MARLAASPVAQMVPALLPSARFLSLMLPEGRFRLAVSRVTIKSTGLELSRIVAGCWRLVDWKKNRSEIDAWIRGCLDLGVDSFDHADIYGGYACEAAFGEALEPSLRRKLKLVTKCGICLVSPARPGNRIHHYDSSRGHILGAVEGSLRALRTDYVDLLLIHRPDPLLDADEVGVAFESLYRTGKVLNFGVSNFMPWQFELLAGRLGVPLVTNQIELHVGNLESLHDGTVDQCQRLRIPPMAWSPLGGGALFRSEEPRWQRIRNALSRVGSRHDGASLEEVAIAWLLRHPAGIIPVLGTGQLDRLRAIADAERMDLDRQDWFEIWEASAGHGVP
jgi:predicted oxidoreductase